MDRIFFYEITAYHMYFEEPIYSLTVFYGLAFQLVQKYNLMDSARRATVTSRDRGLCLPPPASRAQIEIYLISPAM